MKQLKAVKAYSLSKKNYKWLEKKGTSYRSTSAFLDDLITKARGGK